MLNAIWVGLVVVAVVVAAFTGKMEAVSRDAFEATKGAINTLIGLTGGMILFLGLVKVASEGGLLRWIVRGLRPILRRLFPEVPAEHPAMQAMIMNLAANMLGLGNAATPFGLKAMVELDRLNPQRGSATNAMALFLAINATAFHLMPPTGTVFVRVAAGSQAPFAIWIPTVIATLASTLTAVAVCLALQHLAFFRPRPPADVAPRGAGAGRSARREAAGPRRAGGAGARRGGPPSSAAPRCWCSGASSSSGRSTLPRSAPGPSCATRCSQHWLLPLLILCFVAIGRPRTRARLRRADRGQQGRPRRRGTHRALSRRDPGGGRDVPRLGRARDAGERARSLHVRGGIPRGGAADGAAAPALGLGRLRRDGGGREHLRARLASWAC